MGTSSKYQLKFDNLQCCVLIPTYNNATTLNRVLEEVLAFSSNIIVVDDGSTDHTSLILSHYDELAVIRTKTNKGKGHALRIGFQKAEELGYAYAISIDSDGQHYPDDLPVFLEALELQKDSDPELLVVGSRKMDDPSVPDKSSLGNRLSSFWYWVETGIRLQDTQCGYRLYPLRTVNSLELFTSRFELEIEVLVKAAWAGVKVINLPVKVYYDPLERVTHFRPFMDVLRITLLNIYFVGYALIIIAPRALFRRFKSGSRELSSRSVSEF